jgi:hypothetical protein
MLTEWRREHQASVLCMCMFVLCVCVCVWVCIKFIYFTPTFIISFTSFGINILCPLTLIRAYEDETSSSCRTPVISTSRSTMFFNFGRKGPFNKLKNPSLSPRRGPWLFRSLLRGLDSLKLASGCLRTFTGTSSENWTKTDEDAFFMWGDYKGEVQISVSPDFSAWFLQVILRDSCIATCIVGHQRWSRKPACPTTGSAFILNCYLFVSFRTFC